MGKLNKFLLSLYQILSISDYQNAIRWNQSGDKIEIHDIQFIQNQIVPKYFRLNKFASFVRQLHLYGFRKTSKKGMIFIFENQFFLKLDKSLAYKIKRKRKTKKNQKLQNATQKTFLPSQDVQEIYQSKQNQQQLDKVMLKSNEQLSQFLENPSYQAIYRRLDHQIDDIFQF